MQRPSRNWVRNRDHSNVHALDVAGLLAESAKEFIARASENTAKKESSSFGVFRGERAHRLERFRFLRLKARKTEIGYWIVKDEEGKGIVSAVCNS